MEAPPPLPIPFLEMTLFSLFVSLEEIFSAANCVGLSGDGTLGGCAFCANMDVFSFPEAFKIVETEATFLAPPPISERDAKSVCSNCRDVASMA